MASYKIKLKQKKQTVSCLPFGAQFKVSTFWGIDQLRRVGDSNPRNRLRFTRFPSERTRPLCELSPIMLIKLALI